jgi:non-ribosomal peptide synthetase component F
VVGEGFDVSVEVPVRVRLFVVGEGEYVLVVVVHHIAADGWSVAPLVRDVGVAYAARCVGAAPVFPVLPVQYGDFVLWQRELLGDEDDPGSVVSGQLDYWRGVLAGVVEQVELPVDRPRPVRASFRGSSVEVWVDAGLHEGLVGLARRGQVTLFMVVQAAFAVLLSRLGAGVDIPIGTPVAGRVDEALDDVVGMFVNTLVLRTDVSGDPSFRELLSRVRGVDLGAFGHQDVPFERLVEVVNPVRSLGRHPLFQVMLAFQNVVEPDVRLPGLSVCVESVELPWAKFDLVLEVRDRYGPGGVAAGIEGRLGYATDLFDRSTVVSMVDRLLRVFAAVVADADVRVSQIDVLSVAERRAVLVEWNDTAVPVGPATVPVLFEAQVRRSPQATAVVTDDGQLTYTQLNAQANQLARLLISHGVGPERFVAVALPRSERLIVAFLAVLKAGGAYVPLDTDYPTERIAFMLRDTAPACLLTTTDLAGSLPTQPDTPRILLDHPDTAHALAGYPVTDPGDLDRTRPLHPDHPIYVIYTSGSTGIPKGVATTHAGIVNHLVWSGDQLPLGTGDRPVPGLPVSRR